MLTEFGKFLRKLRLDHQELLKDMALRLDVSAAFLSSVETGKKSVPPKMKTDIISLYGLNSHQLQEMEKTIERSVRSVSIDLSQTSSEHRELAVALARKFSSLDPQTLDQIKTSIANTLQRRNDEDA